MVEESHTITRLNFLISTAGTLTFEWLGLCNGEAAISLCNLVYCSRVEAFSEKRNKPPAQPRIRSCWLIKIEQFMMSVSAFLIWRGFLSSPETPACLTIVPLHVMCICLNCPPPFLNAEIWHFYLYEPFLFCLLCSSTP